MKDLEEDGDSVQDSVPGAACVDVVQPALGEVEYQDVQARNGFEDKFFPFAPAIPKGKQL